MMKMTSMVKIYDAGDGEAARADDVYDEYDAYVVYAHEYYYAADTGEYVDAVVDDGDHGTDE